MRAVRSRHPHGARYPWDDWFAKGEVTLHRGRHFQGLPHGMAQSARKAAASRGLKVSVSIGQDRITVKVKA